MADYYPGAESDMSDNSTTATPENSDPMAKEDNADEESQETALVPLSFFGDKTPEVGHECTVKVVHVYDDEIEIEYMDEEAGEGEGKSGSEMGKAMDRMGSMAGESTGY